MGAAPEIAQHVTRAYAVNAAADIKNGACPVSAANAERARILLVVDGLYPSTGGAEVQARLLSRTLAAQGHEVSVVAPLLAPYQTAHENVDGVPLERIRYPKVRLLGAVILCVRFAAFLLARRKRYDAIHVHMAQNLAAICGLLRPLLHATVTVKISGAWEFDGGILDPRKRDRFPYRVLNAWVRRADHIQCISAYTQQMLLDAGYRPQTLLQVPNAVDLTRFAPSGIQNGTGPVRVVSVGRHVPVKGLYVLLEAWRLADLGRSARLVLAGDGPERAGLMARAQALGIADSVDFLGTVADVPALLASSSVYVQASFQEGLSNAVLEAMASALPVVATRISGNTDLVQDGDNGLLVEPGDAAGLASALSALVRDPQRAHRLGQRARASVESRFALPVVLSRLLQAYRTSSQ